MEPFTGMTSRTLMLVVMTSWLAWVVLPDPMPSRHRQGSVKLHSGMVEGTGNVLVHDGHHWGAICDDGWDLNAAHVICRMLGYRNALGHTKQAYFAVPEEDIVLDDVQCFGDEADLTQCRHREWGEHDCDPREAAGVFCAPNDANQAPARRIGIPGRTVATTTTTTATNTATATGSTTTGSTTTGSTTTASTTTSNTEPVTQTTTGSDRVNSVLIEKAMKLQERAQQLQETHVHNPDGYEVRLVNGRNPREGRVEVNIGGQWGTICSDHWTLLEGTVVCQQLGKGYAAMAVRTSSFGGQHMDKLLSGIHCDGEEESLPHCYHEHLEGDVMCSARNMVAGVVCSPVLPDLVPNATLLLHSAYLEDRPIIYLQCAMEENCASSSAYTIRDNHYDWQMMRRRLLRFSSSTWNFGTAAFRPHLPKENWEWHNCHAHYHSMSVFAHYDLLDLHGNQVAEGHKASFCLEDVECLPGRRKKYQCKGFADQGISVGCADNYLHDIDCQWIDVTDVKPGHYIFRIHINPELKVAELSYTNNAATCALEYTGMQVYTRNCTLGMGL